MQPIYRMIQKNGEQKGQLSSQSMNESIEPIQPISAIISQLLEKYELLDDVEPLESPALDDHFSYALRWGSVLKESNLNCQSVSSPSTGLD